MPGCVAGLRRRAASPGCVAGLRRHDCRSCSSSLVPSLCRDGESHPAARACRPSARPLGGAAARNIRQGRASRVTQGPCGGQRGPRERGGEFGGPQRPCCRQREPRQRGGEFGSRKGPAAASEGHASGEANSAAHKGPAAASEGHASGEANSAAHKGPAAASESHAGGEANSAARKGPAAASESHAGGKANSAARCRRSGLHQRGILDYSIAFQNIKATKKI
jgi:hypothetical protein